GDVLLAVDGGASMALAAGLSLDLVVGDFDSLPAADLEILEGRTLIWRYPPEKDQSDLEIALEAALELKPPEIVVLGALGGRLDHLLMNISLLHRPHRAGVRARLLGAGGAAMLVDREEIIDAPPGTLVSILPLTPQVEGVVLDGLLYPLREETLGWGTSRGLSNVVVTAPARISVGAGTLLVIWLDPGPGT
ncbi:MAG: thiamine diphosphokinase, partial [Armatimonadetes bacterium]|nr:thiamine diphosphokinase [Armatimonadota bacterium]